MQTSETKAKFSLIFSMLVFGTIGIFRKYIPLSSSMLAMMRGFIGALFIYLMLMVRRQPISGKAIRKNLLLLLISGAAIGFNWILLFESYHYTTVATATLCYYFAPTFVILASPVVLKEKLTKKQMVCVVVSLIGMVFVSGVLQSIPTLAEAKGILFGIGAAVLYASVILMNKKISGISAYDKTMMQLVIAATVLVPYTLMTEDITAVSFDAVTVILVLVVGIIHTGIAYTMYFGSISSLKSQTVAIFSYIDPISAIILSALFLDEAMTVTGIIGAVLILGAALISELPDKKKA